MFIRSAGWIAAAVALCLFGENSSLAKKPPPEASCDKSRPICLIAHASRFTDGVNGIIVNQSGAAFDNISVTFTLRNRDSIVDTPSAALGASLRPGEKWEFTARTHQVLYLVTGATLETWSNGRHDREDVAGFAPICVAPVVSRGCRDW
jgi:hypothetical protein